MDTRIYGPRKTSELLPMNSLTSKTPEQPRNTFYTFGIHGKKGDIENLRNTIYLAFRSVGEGGSGIQYVFYIV